MIVFIKKYVVVVEGLTQLQAGMAMNVTMVTPEEISGDD